MYLKNFKEENFLIFIDKLSKIYQATIVHELLLW